MDECAKHRLLDWYRASHRDLPWRRTRDPYRILVSEVMLQQTQAERVIPKYGEFLKRFPTLQVLADAPAAEVIRAWSGLGYNRRALNLQRACRAIVECFGGEMPRDPGELASLPGVGPYTAGAVACFAFGADVGFVDTNIRRVLHRVAVGPELPASPLTDKAMRELATALVPEGRGYEWNQALMELGATVCRARSVACEICPLQSACAARPTIAAALALRSTPNGKRAGRFKASDRYVRGRIVDALRRARAGLTLDEIIAATVGALPPSDVATVTRCIAALERDGLVVALAPLPALREDAAEYDGQAAPARARYGLPD